MVAANFVVITNGGGARLLEQPISTNSVPRLSFRELRLVVDYLEGSLSVATWDDTAWIGGTALVVYTDLWFDQHRHTLGLLP